MLGKSEKNYWAQLFTTDSVSNQVVMSTITFKLCECSCEVSTSWSLICDVCSVESASHGRSPVRPGRKCAVNGSRAFGLMSEPLTADSDPCSGAEVSSALLAVRVRTLALPLLLSHLLMLYNTTLNLRNLIHQWTLSSHTAYIYLLRTTFTLL